MNITLTESPPDRVDIGGPTNLEAVSPPCAATISNYEAAEVSIIEPELAKPAKGAKQQIFDEAKVSGILEEMQTLARKEVAETFWEKVKLNPNTGKIIDIDAEVVPGGSPELTKPEARKLVNQMKARVDRYETDQRADLLRLYEGKGWKALGYKSWRECGKAEFGVGQSRIYQLLDAGKVERNILFHPVENDYYPQEQQRRPAAAPNAPLPEKHLRQIRDLKPDDQRKVWAEVEEVLPDKNDRTAEDIRLVRRKVMKESEPVKTRDEGPAEVSREEWETRLEEGYPKWHNQLLSYYPEADRRDIEQRISNSTVRRSSTSS